MEHENLFRKLDYIIKEIERLDKENPTGPDEESDPRIERLIEEGEEIMRELDPLVRGTLGKRRKELAEWDSIMHMNDDLNEEGAGGKSDS